MSFAGTLSVGFTGKKSWFTKSVPGIVWLIPVFGSVTVAVPSSLTFTSLPGFFALTLSSTCFFSSGVKCALSLTITFSVGFTGVKSFTVKSFTGMSTDSPVVLSVTVILPLLSAVTIVFGLDFLTLSTNFSISWGVKCSGFGTTIGKGIVTSNSLAGSPLALVNLPGIVISVVPSFGSLPSSWAIPFPVVGFSGNSLWVNSTFPPVTAFSLAIPGNLTLVPSGTPSTVTSTSPVCGFCVPTINVGVEPNTNFAGIFLLSIVSAGSFSPSLTVTFPVCILSFKLSFKIVISPFVTNHVPSIPGIETIEPFE